MSQDDQIKIDLLSPQEIAVKACEIGEKKASLGLGSTILLSILAGSYIAFGAVFATISITGMVDSWPYGFMKVMAGLTFSLGLILVVIGGAELFTGNNLMFISWVNRKITFGKMMRNWVIVYFGNFIGSLLIAILVFLTHTYTASSGELGKTMLNLANVKVHYSFIQALVLGILCNILVCLAVWLAYSSRTTSGKILSIIFPITAFIAAGFEHSVANMYILPVALFIKAFDPSFAESTGLDLTSLSWTSFFIKNLIPVTIGNILGGAGFVGGIYALLFPVTKREKK
jgi:formate transporter